MIAEEEDTAMAKLQCWKETMREQKGGESDKNDDNWETKKRRIEGPCHAAKMRDNGKNLRKIPTFGTGETSC